MVQKGNLNDVLEFLDNMPERAGGALFFRGVNLSDVRGHLTVDHWLKLVGWLYDRWKQAESAGRGRESLDNLFNAFGGR